MAMTREEFKRKLLKSVQSFSAKSVTEDEIERGYQNYLTGVEITNSDGNLRFYKDDNGKLRWDFEPVEGSTLARV